MVSNSVNFGSTPLHQANLRNASGGLTRVVISELNPKDFKDVAALEQVAKDWCGAKYAKRILNFFKGQEDVRLSRDADVLEEKNHPHTNNYYAVELLGDKPLHERIVGLLQTTFQPWYNSSNFEMDFLQVKPGMEYVAGVVRDLRGVGELLVAKTCDVAKKFGAKGITIESRNNDFFLSSTKRAGIKLVDGANEGLYGQFYLEAADYDKYLEHVKDTYKTEF